MSEKEDFSVYNGEGTILRKAQVRLLDMLTEVDRICRKNGIEYWLCFGTLLGAIRHNGFIPWDDDIDICIRKRDYKKLKKKLLEELPEQYFLTDWKTDKYHFDNYGRVKDKKSYFGYSYFRKQKVQGLALDIFTISRYPSRKSRSFINFFFRKVFRESHNYGELEYDSRSIIRRNKIIAYITIPFIYIFLWLIKGIGTLNRKKIVAYDYMTSTYTHSMKDIFPLKEHIFEGRMFYIPANPEKNLEEVYGKDFMQLPPKEKRVSQITEIRVYD